MAGTNTQKSSSSGSIALTILLLASTYYCKQTRLCLHSVILIQMYYVHCEHIWCLECFKPALFVKYTQEYIHHIVLLLDESVQFFQSRKSINGDFSLLIELSSPKLQSTFLSCILMNLCFSIFLNPADGA